MIVLCTAKYSLWEAENLEKMVPNELYNCTEIKTSLLRQWVLTSELRSYFFHCVCAWFVKHENVGLMLLPECLKQSSWTDQWQYFTFSQTSTLPSSLYDWLLPYIVCWVWPSRSFTKQSVCIACDVSLSDEDICWQCHGTFCSLFSLELKCCNPCY